MVRAVIKSEVDYADTVLHLGALYGYHMLTLRNQVGDDGEVYAIEPEPQKAEFIQQTVERNGFENFTVVQSAISDQPGLMTFYHHQFPSKSGLTKRDDLAYEAEYEVSVQTIPQIWINTTSIRSTS